MDTSDHTEFRQRLIGLAEVFDAKMSPQRVALYFEALRDLPFDAVVTALSRAVQTCTFLPRPAELRTLVLGDDEDHAEAGWMAMRAAFHTVGAYASLATSDPALGETITALFGTWPHACSQEFSPEMWSSKRKEFGRIYRVLRDRRLTGTRYLAGICEQQNAGHPEWLRFVTVGVIGPAGEISQLRGDQADGYRTAIASGAGFSRLASSGLTIQQSSETA